MSKYTHGFLIGLLCIGFSLAQDDCIDLTILTIDKSSADRDWQHIKNILLDNKDTKDKKKLEYRMYGDKPGEGDIAILFNENNNTPPLVWYITADGYGHLSRDTRFKNIIATRGDRYRRCFSDRFVPGNEELTLYEYVDDAEERHQLYNLDMDNPQINDIKEKDLYVRLHLEQTKRPVHSQGEDLTLYEYDDGQRYQLYSLKLEDLVKNSLEENESVFRLNLIPTENPIDTLGEESLPPLRKDFNRYDTLFYRNSYDRSFSATMEDNDLLFDVNPVHFTADPQPLFTSKINMLDYETNEQVTLDVMSTDYQKLRLIEGKNLYRGENELITRSVKDPITGRTLSEVYVPPGKAANLKELYTFQKNLKQIDIPDYQEGGEEKAFVRGDFNKEPVIPEDSKPDKDKGSIPKLFALGVCLLALAFVSA